MRWSGPLWENAGLVQFVHRMVAYLLLALGGRGVGAGAQIGLPGDAGRVSHDDGDAGGAGWLGDLDGAVGGTAASGDHASGGGGGAVGIGAAGAASGDLSRSGIDPGGDGMSNNTAFKDLMAFQRQTEALAGVAGRLGWDQETMMPRGAAEQRGEEMAAMEGILHARRTDPRVGEWLAAADPSTDV